jgi:hypothetical protein
MFAGSGIYAGDPQTSEVSFLLAPVDVGILPALLDRILSYGPNVLPAAEVSFGCLEVLLLSRP